MALLAVAVMLMAAGPVQAWQTGAERDYQGHVAVAAERFGLTPDLITQVIAAESGGAPEAVSAKGAMGLMQLMPATWQMLRARLNLGTDPFDPRDNILAGAAYLRELRDRYGAPGFLAAYNAGPGRYEQSLAGRPLPGETLAYVARLGRGDDPSSHAAKPVRPTSWTEAQLFSPGWPANADAIDNRIASQKGVDAAPETPRASGLFAPRTLPMGRP